MRLEGELGGGIRPRVGQHVEEILRLTQDQRAVLHHFLRPAQALVLDDRTEQEERPSQSQRLPTLRERPTSFAGFDDDRCVGDQSHGAIALGIVGTQDR